MNKKGKIVIVLAIITIIVIGFCYYVSLNTVYLGNNTRAIVLGKKIIKIKNNNKIVLRKVNYYKDGKRFDGYLKSTKDDNGYSYYAVSKYNKKVNTNDLLASGKMLKMNIVSSSNINTSLNDSTLSTINELLDLKLGSDNILEYKSITYDIDNDSSDENVVFVKYRVDTTITVKIFINDDSVIDILEFENDFTNISSSSNKVYYLTSVADINNDKNFEIIVARIDGDSQPTYYDIYSYENGNIKEIK